MLATVGTDCLGAYVISMARLVSHLICTSVAHHKSIILRISPQISSQSPSFKKPSGLHTPCASFPSLKQRPILNAPHPQSIACYLLNGTGKRLTEGRKSCWVIRTLR